MSKRRSRQKVVNSKVPQTKSEMICSASFITGLLLAVLMIDIYRFTIISWQLPFCFALITGITSAVLARNSNYNKINFPPGHAKLTVFYYVVAVGFSLSYFLFAGNYYLAYDTVQYYEFPIKEKASMPGGKNHRSERQPLVRFDYFGKEKELVFAYSQTSEVQQANKE